MEINKISESKSQTGLFIALGCGFSLFAFVVGLIVGLVVLGWWVWPVQWIDAAPTDLHHGYQQIYVEMIVDSYDVNHNLELAKSRLSPWVEEDALRLLEDVKNSANEKGLTERVIKIQVLIDSFENSPLE